MNGFPKEKIIPAIDYCRVVRAAEILSCTVDDILYWAGEGKIKLCVKLYDAKGRIFVPGIPDPANLLAFFYDMMNNYTNKNIVKNGSEYLKPYPLISIYPNILMNLKTKDDCEALALRFFSGDGFPVSVDGLWELAGNLFVHYSYDTPPILGRDCLEFEFISKALEVLNMNLSNEQLTFIKNTSFSLNPADTDDEIGDYRLMADIQDKPIVLSVDNLYITKKHILFIQENLLEGFLDEGNSTSSKRNNVTAKQSLFTVALLRKIGFTDSDLTGSITELRRKLAKLAPDAPVPEDDKPLIEWLRKGGVRR